MEVEIEMVSKRVHELLVGIGLSANAVMEVRDGEHHAELIAQFQHRAQKCDRIRSSRDSDTHAVSRAHKLSLADEVKKLA
jgi:hypothetical protein